MASDLPAIDDLAAAVPPIAAVRYESGFPIDKFLAAIAARLQGEKVRLGGLVQHNGVQFGTDMPPSGCADMTLVDLATGERVGISQDLGADAQGCRLDSGGLVELGGRLERAIDGSIDLLILNKFGKAEAEGNGLRGAIARAIDVGIPLLTAVRPVHDEAWRQFHGGLAIELAPNAEQVLAWCREAVRERRAETAPQPAEA